MKEKIDKIYVYDVGNEACQIGDDATKIMCKMRYPNGTKGETLTSLEFQQFAGLPVQASVIKQKLEEQIGESLKFSFFVENRLTQLAGKIQSMERLQESELEELEGAVEDYKDQIIEKGGELGLSLDEEELEYYDDDNIMDEIDEEYAEDDDTISELQDLFSDYRDALDDWRELKELAGGGLDAMDFSGTPYETAIFLDNLMDVPLGFFVTFFLTFRKLPNSFSGEYKFKNMMVAFEHLLMGNTSEGNYLERYRNNTEALKGIFEELCEAMQ